MIVLSLSFFLILAGILCVIALFRLDRVYSIRVHFIYNEPFPDSYQSLPSYDEMTFHPKHWLRWSVISWKEWITTT